MPTKERIRGATPLRRIVREFNDPRTGAQREELECGHVIGRKKDLYGHTNAFRRRCAQCAFVAAAAAWPHGATLTCKKCSYVEEVTSVEAARFLAKGWPKHCGEVMACQRTEPLGARAVEDGAAASGDG